MNFKATGQLNGRNGSTLASRFRTVELTCYDNYDSTYDTGNSERPIVLVHGLFGNGADFTSTAEALQQKLGNRVFTVDLRNHGQSPWRASMSFQEMAGDLERFLDSRAVFNTGVVLLGHSMGGKVAALLAMERADLVEKLIIEDVSPTYSYLNTPLSVALPMFIQAMEELPLDSIESKQQAMKLLGGVVTDPVACDYLLGNLVYKSGEFSWQINFDAIKRSLDVLLDFPTMDDAFCFSKPTLLIKGQKSDCILPEHLSEIVRRFPMAKIKAVAESGHWIHNEKPKDFIDQVVEFCRENEN